MTMIGLIKSKIDVKKFKDVEKSLLDENWAIYKRKFLTFIIITSTIGIFFFFPLTIFALIDHKYKRKAYLEAKELRDANEETLLLKQVKYHLGSTLQDLLTFEQKIFALVDLKNEEVGKIIYEKLKGYSISPSPNTMATSNSLKDALDVLALRLGYKSKEELIEIYESEITPSKIRGIPISKIYFLDDLPTKEKCMVSKLILDFDSDEIIACPFCGNMAKHDLLEKWLQKNKTCPICKQQISITDCPIVKIK